MDERLVDPLTAAVRAIQPDLVVVSGDFTQRARASQFRRARELMAALPGPQLGIPGNHDVPLYNFLSRFLRPLVHYERNITRDLQPRYIDAEMVVIGVNTARSLTLKRGRINEGQVARACATFRAEGKGRIKVLVTHHPFDPPESRIEDRVGRAAMAMRRLDECGVDLLLAGHSHTGDTGHTTSRYSATGRSTLLVQAGTVTSTRLRGQANSFNVLRIDAGRIAVEVRAWRPASSSFEPTDRREYALMNQGWVSCGRSA